MQSILVEATDKEYYLTEGDNKGEMIICGSISAITLGVGNEKKSK